MSLLTIFVLTIAGITLIKLGALAVWVGLLTLSLKLAIVVAMLVAAWLSWKHFKNS